jgi:hypothetical protein
MADANPYVASSKAIERAVGNSGGIPNNPDLSKGAVKPTIKPYGQPQINPHKITGMCIRHKIELISGICKFKKGRTKAKARKIADKVIL